MSSSVSYEYQDAPSWMLRVMKRLNTSPCVELHVEESSWKKQLFPDRTIALQTKLRTVNLLIDEAGSLDRTLQGSWPTNEKLCESASKRQALELHSPTIAYRLISRLSSILYELQAAREILFALLKTFYRKIVRRAGAGDAEILEYLTDSGLPTSWIGELDNVRNRFLHQTAPWLGVALDPTEHALLLESYPSNPSTERTLRYSEIRRFAQDFSQFLQRLDQHLVECVEEYEAEKQSD